MYRGIFHSVVSMRYGVQYSVGAPKIFFPFYTSNQNFLCTKGCLKRVEGIKKLTFSKIGCQRYELFHTFSRPPRYF